MKLDYNVDTIPNLGKSSTPVGDILYEFARSGKVYARVEGIEEHYKNALNASNSLREGIRYRADLRDIIKVSRRGDAIYLVRKDV